MEFRLLKAEEIDVKVGTITKGGVTLLLYKNARVDMAILDETVGAENWQRDHKEVKGNLYCGIGINVNYGVPVLSGENNLPVYPQEKWVWKWDCGVESAFGDKEKGEASDSFKRAGFNWGIGRELYTSPFIFIPCETEEIQNNGKKAYKIKSAEDSKRIAGLRVEKIEYNDKKEIKSITIVDSNGMQVYPQFNSQEIIEKSKKAQAVVDKIINGPAEKTISKDNYICEECQDNVTEKVAKYSLDKFGRCLCFDCQKLNAGEVIK